MRKKPRVKILVGYHKPAYLLKSDVFVPIHLGRALAARSSKDGSLSAEDCRWLEENMTGDDDGDNISADNRKFCELTAFYWAWKNYDRLGNPDYIGFMHYRRHLSFNRNKHFAADKYGFVEEPAINEEYLQKFRLDDESVEDAVRGRDVLIAARTDLKRLGTLSPYNHYENSQKKLHIGDYEKALEVLRKKYPEYVEAAVKYNNGDYAYFTNVLIMRKEIFMHYCAWLFDILTETDKRLDYTGYNVEEMRALAYIAEWLCGIYVTRLLEIGGNVLELQEAMAADTSVCPEIRPAFADNNIPVCFSADAGYILYTGVAVRSLMAHANGRDNYDIIIFAGDVPAEEKEKIARLAVGRKNFSIRFVDINRYIDRALSQNFFLISHFSAAVYYRIFIADILQAYDRVLYLDSDLVLEADAASLWRLDIGGKALGAAADTEVIRMYYTDDFIKNYLDRTLGINNPYRYFNSGVLIMSLAKMRAADVKDKFVEVMNRVKSPYMVDQDILNVIFQDDVCLLPGCWNYEYHLPIWHREYRLELPATVLEDYLQSREQAKIVHFAGSKKPWNCPQYDMADRFWHYARQTPFYEEILQQGLLARLSPPQSEPVKKERVSFVDDYLLARLRYAKCKLLSKICFGQKRACYRQQRKQLKRELKQIKRAWREQENARRAA